MSGDLTHRAPSIDGDLSVGDFGTAKRRLCSFIAGTKYDPEVCGRIGDICRKMKDPVEAGRWYFISDRKTSEIKREVYFFVESHNRKLGIVLSQFPTRAKLADLDEYPTPVRERLKELGCESGPGTSRPLTVISALTGSGFNPKLGRKSGVLANLANGVGCLVVIAVATVMVIGLYTIQQWLR